MSSALFASPSDILRAFSAELVESEAEEGEEVDDVPEEDDDNVEELSGETCRYVLACIDAYEHLLTACCLIANMKARPKSMPSATAARTRWTSVPRSKRLLRLSGTYYNHMIFMI